MATWAQLYDPFGNRVLSTAVAALPVLTLFFVLVVLKRRVWVAALSGLLMSVDLAGTVAGKPLKASTPQMLFRGLRILTPFNYDLSPGGDRFLVLTFTSDPTSRFAPIVIETNWMPPK